MPLLIIPVLIAFIWAAPRFFKWLLLFSVMAGGLFFVGLTGLSMAYGARKGGANEGMFEEWSIHLLMYFLTVPAGIIVLGALVGLTLKLGQKSRLQ